MNHAEIRKIVARIEAKPSAFPAVLVSFANYFKTADDNMQDIISLLRVNQDIARDIFKTMGNRNRRMDMVRKNRTQYAECLKAIADRHNVSVKFVNKINVKSCELANSERLNPAFKLTIYWRLFNASKEQLVLVHSALAYNVNKQGNFEEISKAVPDIFAYNPEHISEILSFRLIHAL